jgi:hypothetical protein
MKVHFKIADFSNIFGLPATLLLQRYPLDILNIWLWRVATISCSNRENGLNIPVDPDNLTETNDNVSLSLLGATSKTMDFCLID